jgi:hypothetical protein
MYNAAGNATQGTSGQYFKFNDARKAQGIVPAPVTSNPVRIARMMIGREYQNRLMLAFKN